MRNFSTIISSPLDRENVVFEIWLGMKQVAEVSSEPNFPMKIEIYANPEDRAWEFELDEFRAVLESAAISLGKNPGEV